MADELAQDFGKVLRETRKRQGLSQQSLALETDLDRTYISLLERGKRQPSLRTLFILAEALGTRASSLVRKLEVS